MSRRALSAMRALSPRRASKASPPVAVCMGNGTQGPPGEAQGEWTALELVGRGNSPRGLPGSSSLQPAGAAADSVTSLEASTVMTPSTPARPSSPSAMFAYEAGLQAGRIAMQARRNFENGGGGRLTPSLLPSPELRASSTRDPSSSSEAIPASARGTAYEAQFAALFSHEEPAAGDDELSALEMVGMGGGSSVGMPGSSSSSPPKSDRCSGALRRSSGGSDGARDDEPAVARGGGSGARLETPSPQAGDGELSALELVGVGSSSSPSKRGSRGGARSRSASGSGGPDGALSNLRI